jgi:hypothetical protein
MEIRARLVAGPLLKVKGTTGNADGVLVQAFLAFTLATRRTFRRHAALDLLFATSRATKHF